jgi:hypothetical protein
MAAGDAAMTPSQDLLLLWQARLRLQDWAIRLSELPPDDGDERSSVNIDANVRQAVIRFDPVMPADQAERQLLHELLHVRLVVMEDAFSQVVGDDETARQWWKRGEESAIEALVDALLPGYPRREYRGDAAWVEP